MPALRGTASREALWKQMLLFFLPLLFGTFFQQLYNTVDAVIVGQFVGKEALAAVGGSSAAIINLLVGFFMGLSNGATVIIAQSYGAGDRQNVSRAVHTGIALSIAAGAAPTLLGVLFGGSALRMMGTPQDVYSGSRVYLTIYFCGMVPNLVYNIGAGILRAVGDSKRPLYFLIITCFANIGLDLLFVAVLHWGVAGVAAATILSQTISAAMVILTLTRSREVYHLELRSIRFHGKTLKRIVSIGIPSGIQSAMYAISNLLIQSSVNAFGTDTVAAWTAFGKLDTLYWMGSGSFGIAVSTFAGQSYGAGDYNRMRSAVRSGFVMNAIYAVFLSTAMFFGGQFALRLFLEDETVIGYGVTMSRFISTAYLLFIPIELLAAVCRSAGDTLRPTIMTAVGICGFRTVWLFTVLPIWHTRQMLYISYPLSWAITSVLFILYYRKGTWLRKHQ